MERSKISRRGHRVASDRATPRKGEGRGGSLTTGTATHRAGGASVVIAAGFGAAHLSHRVRIIVCVGKGGAQRVNSAPVQLDQGALPCAVAVGAGHAALSAGGSNSDGSKSPLASANGKSDGLRHLGIEVPFFQLDTVEGDRSNLDATTTVPPSALMKSATVMRSTITLFVT